MKSLKTIQTLSKIGKIISKIVYICCIVGFIGCAVGIVAISIVGNALDMEMPLAAVVAGLILCAGEYVAARMAYRYFENELNAGTPFTLEGANELMRLGIFVIGIDVASGILAQVAHGIIRVMTGNMEALTLEDGDSVALGIMLIVISVFCRYGAELVANQAAKEANSDEQMER